VPTRRRSGVWLSLAVAVLANAVLLWHFHDRFWYVRDEGVYAQIAERVLAGEVLNRDVQALHPGYVNFVNAAAFALFGVDLVSLRYPLVAAVFLQAMLLWGLLWRRSLVLAPLVSVCAVVLGFLQFINPAAHWYSLTLGTILACWLTWIAPGHPARTYGAGVLVGLIALFRQLTGVWAGMAVVVVLLYERRAGARGRDVVLERLVLSALLVLLLAYPLLSRTPEATGLLLLATWPAAILVQMLRRPGTANGAVVTMTAQIALGVLVAALPLVGYHVAHGSLDAWFDDSVRASLSLGAASFNDGAVYGLLPLAGLLQVVKPTGLAAFVNGLFWMLLPLVPVAGGALTVRWMWRRETEVPILPVVAAFYSLVTLHMAGAIYLSFSVGLAIAAVAWFVVRGTARWAPAGAWALASLAAVGLVYHAGQSPFRSRMETARGLRTVTAGTETCPPAARASLEVARAECEPYWQIVRAIRTEAPDGTSILALPNDAELYFLADRTNPFRFYNSALGLTRPEQVDAVLDTLRADPPRVVAFRPDDRYNTDASRRIMRAVRDRYERFDTIAGVELYRPLQEVHAE